MIYSIVPAQYLDEISRRGIQIVLLHLEDDLYPLALGEFEKVSIRVGNEAWIRLLDCSIKTPEDCVEVQACKFPQVRFFVNGNEHHSHVGKMTVEEILDRIHAIENIRESHRC
jgi:hypothetical protein